MTGSIQAFIEDHADRFREARLLVRNEFTGLDAHATYLNAFSRLLRMDPLNRLPMLGTDQRDLFIPVISHAVEARFSRPIQVLDVGCGDGKTFSLLAHAIPAGSTLDAFDPNPDYVAQYRRLIGADPRLQLRLSQAAGFGAEEGFDATGGYDLILAIHVIYFFEDLDRAIEDLFRRLAPGGVALVVFADELDAFTGLCQRAWLDHAGDLSAKAEHENVCRARLDLFDEAALAERLSAIDPSARVKVTRQGSRLYGHSLSDILALSNLTGLAAVSDLAKFEAVGDLVEQAPDRIGLRIEGQASGPRAGMFSVAQPQLVVEIWKA